MQGNVRGVITFIIACITSPCCTPLIVPVLFTLLAGTPAALWMSQNLGWVYGALTAVSLISFVLALRWLNRRKTSQATTIRPSDIPVIGDKAHVE
jgi:membrane protein implicated in regulation of membrane protease activity